MKRAATVGKVAQILLAVFVAWIVGIVCWNSSSRRHPMAGQWESPYLTKSSLTVHSDGTFHRFENGKRLAGTWKPIKAWKADGFTPPGAMIRRLVPYYSDEEVEADSHLRDLRLKGGLHPIDDAYLFEENGNHHVVAQVRDKAGDRLEANALEWNYRRPSMLPDWITDWRFLLIPETTP